MIAGVARGRNSWNRNPDADCGGMLKSPRPSGPGHKRLTRGALKAAPESYDVTTWGTQEAAHQGANTKRRHRNIQAESWLRMTWTQTGNFFLELGMLMFGQRHLLRLTLKIVQLALKICPSMAGISSWHCFRTVSLVRFWASRKRIRFPC
ncbi:hypothetical protein MRX96_035284 [Rhipicephalus microplus]